MENAIPVRRFGLADKRLPTNGSESPIPAEFARRITTATSAAEPAQ